jgi:hypothetical protein
MQKYSFGKVQGCRSSVRLADNFHRLDENWGPLPEWMWRVRHLIHNFENGMTKGGYYLTSFWNDDAGCIGHYQTPKEIFFDEEEGFDGGYKKTLLFKFDDLDATEKQIEDSFHDLLDTGNCGCSHDCCGCYFGGVNEIRKISDLVYEVDSSYCPNY